MKIEEVKKILKDTLDEVYEELIEKEKAIVKLKKELDIKDQTILKLYSKLKDKDSENTKKEIKDRNWYEDEIINELERIEDLLDKGNDSIYNKFVLSLLLGTGQIKYVEEFLNNKNIKTNLIKLLTEKEKYYGDKSEQLER